jgi:hypothetical protein
MKVVVPGAFSYFKYVYPGPHLLSDNTIDPGIIYAIPFGLDKSDNSYSWLYFYAGETDTSRFKEVKADWTG